MTVTSPARGGSQASRGLLSDALSRLALVAVLLGTALVALGEGRQSLAVALGLYASVAALALAGLAHHPHPRFGAANTVTSTRVALVAAIVGVAIAEEASDQMRALLSAIAFAALLLDGVDGWAARRFGTASRYGARFDVEIDALTVLVLSILVAATGRTGSWVILLGLMRYLFLAAGAIIPALAQPTPPRFLRKAICVFVVAALAVSLAPIPGFLAVSLCAAAGAALIYSFGSDCVWLLREGRTTRPVSRRRADAI